MFRAARHLRPRGVNVGSCDFLSRTAIKTMATKVFVLPIDPASQSASGVLPSVDPVELWNTTPTSSKPPKVGTTRIFYNTPRADQGNVNATAIVSLGEGFGKKTGHARRELVRKAVGNGVKQVKDLGDGAKDIVIDASQDAHAAGEPYLTVCRQSSSLVVAVAAHLAKYKFTLKTSPPSPYRPGDEKNVPREISFQPIQSSKGWEDGVIYADAQNLARTVPIISSLLEERTH
jgi:cytosol aminopeptidase